MKKEHVKLTDEDRETLQTLLAKGSLKARLFKRATALLELDRGKTLEAVAVTLGVNYNTIAHWRDRYNEGDLASALYDKPRAGRPIEIDGAARAKVTALACTQAPTGHAHWGLKRLAAKAVELEYCDHLSRTQAGKILKKRTSAAPKKHLVHCRVGCFVPGADGRTARFVRGTAPPAIAGDLLR